VDADREAVLFWMEAAYLAVYALAAAAAIAAIVRAEWWMLPFTLWLVIIAGSRRQSALRDLARYR
jgi:hypothetical protein